MLVHPLKLHLTYALAQALQEYFMLRDEDAAADKAEREGKGGGKDGDARGKGRAARGGAAGASQGGDGGKLSTGGAAGVGGSPYKPLSAGVANLPSHGTGGSNLAPGVGGAGAAPTQQPPSRGWFHRRGNSVDSTLGGPPALLEAGNEGLDC